MPVVFSKDFHKDLDVDGSLKGKAWDFVRKLSTDPEITGLDLKQPQGVLDKRVRTARVDGSYRAVLFDMGGDGEPFYLLAAIKQHDDAYTLAGRIELRVNPVNGIAEVLRRDQMSQALRGTPGTDGGGAGHGGDTGGGHSGGAVPTDEATPLLPFTVAELTGIGILDEVAERAVQLTDEEELQDLCLAVPEWQGDALLQLAYGTSLDDVRALYGPQEDAAGGVADDSDIGKALEHPASRMQFVVVTTDDDELRAMLEGDFRHWRTFLHPEQRTVAYRDRWNGSFRLSGGAGTGKTVVAMHRAAFLSSADPTRRVLLTTFTTTLASQLEADLAQLAGPGRVNSGVVRPFEPGTVRVAGVDSLARSIVTRIDGGAPRVVSEYRENSLWEAVVLDLPDLTPQEAELLTPGVLKAEYRDVILAQEITTKKEYLRAPRKGRGVPMNWFQRSRVWEAVEAFRRKLDAEGQTTFTALVARAAAVLADPAARERVETYDSVVVDEAQDLHATHWLLLRRLVDKGPDDLFLCEDAHQRIYGQRLTLSRFGIDIVGRSRKLTLNYRTTRENLRFALAVLGTESVRDLEDNEEDRTGYRSRLSGPEPVVREARTSSAELDLVAETVAGWLTEAEATRPALDAIGVLARTRKHCEELTHRLREAGVPTEMLTADDRPGNPAVRVATMHRAKGTEFARVVVAGASDDVLPQRQLLDTAPEGERADIEARERLLLYVALTRARDQILVTWHGTPSRFLPAGWGTGA